MERGARKIALTNEGSLLLRRAEELVALADTEQEFVSQNERLEGRISIGSGELAAGTVLARCCEAFHAQYPLVAFDLLTANADVVKEQMDKGLIDVGLLLEPVVMPEPVPMLVPQGRVVIGATSRPIREYQAWKKAPCRRCEVMITCRPGGTRVCRDCKFVLSKEEYARWVD